MKTGIVVQNLGSPEAPNPGAVKTYLNEFLMDELVIDIPQPFRSILVKGLIVPFRAKRSAHAYQKIWSKTGSPLVQNTTAFCQALQRKLGSDFSVLPTMRYGSLNPRRHLKSWIEREQIQRILFFPMYPQFSLSASHSSANDFAAALDELAVQLPVVWIKDYFSRPEFIDAEVKVIQDASAKESFDYVLFSYHGLPKRHLRKAIKLSGREANVACTVVDSCCDKLTSDNRDCYRAQCIATTRAITSQLKWDRNFYSTSFQSRLGSGWTEPFTDHELVRLARSGVRRLGVVTPSFTADCLETIEEIGIRARADFQAAGGAELTLIPCLNANQLWVDGVANMVRSELAIDSRGAFVDL